jgi:hypothetical protein
MVWEMSIIDRRWSEDEIMEPGSEMGELSDVSVKLLHVPSSRITSNYWRNFNLFQQRILESFGTVAYQ